AGGDRLHRAGPGGRAVREGQGGGVARPLRGGAAVHGGTGGRGGAGGRTVAGAVSRGRFAGASLRSAPGTRTTGRGIGDSPPVPTAGAWGGVFEAPAGPPEPGPLDRPLRAGHRRGLLPPLGPSPHRPGRRERPAPGPRAGGPVRPGQGAGVDPVPGAGGTAEVAAVQVAE